MLQPFIGDILVEQAGETPGDEAALFILRWDSGLGDFQVRRIPLPIEIGGHLEHVTSAPLDIPIL
jgi:hypothetical protein